MVEEFCRKTEKSVLKQRNCCTSMQNIPARTKLQPAGQRAATADGSRVEMCHLLEKLLICAQLTAVMKPNLLLLVSQWSRGDGKQRGTILSTSAASNLHY